MSPELFTDMANSKKELIVNLAAEYSAHSRELEARSVCSFLPVTILLVPKK